MARRTLVLPNKTKITLIDTPDGKPKVQVKEHIPSPMLDKRFIKLDKYKLPEQTQSGRGLTMRAFMTNTLKGFPNRFTYLKTTGVKVKKMTPLGQNAYKAVTTETARPLEARFHRQVILRLEKEVPFTKSRLAVKCDCSDFKFTFGYVLHKAGAHLKPLDTTLESPDKRNPGNVRGMCKHLIACMKHIASLKEKKK